jgi:hypothetical protein
VLSSLFIKDNIFFKNSLPSEALLTKFKPPGIVDGLIALPFFLIIISPFSKPKVTCPNRTFLFFLTSIRTFDLILSFSICKLISGI